MSELPTNVPDSLVTLEIAETQEEIRANGDGLLAGKLDNVGELALDWCDEILRYPLPDRDDEAFGTIARAKGVAAQTGLTTLVRVNEMRLKRAALGKLPELLRRIREEQQKIRTMLRE